MSSAVCSPTPLADEIIVGGKKLISHARAAFLLGMRPQSLSSALSRGQLELTRYYRGRSPSFDLSEVEKAIVARAVPAGRRVR
jgi:hypothetical protein